MYAYILNFKISLSLSETEKDTTAEVKFRERVGNLIQGNIKTLKKKNLNKCSDMYHISKST